MVRGCRPWCISDGIASDQSSYFWLAMTLAREGYIVVTYDPAGQGDSEGSVANLFDPSVPDCEFGGACRDLQDIMHWLVGDPIPAVVDLATDQSDSWPPAVSGSRSSAPTNPAIHNPAYGPAGANVPDPARRHHRHRQAGHRRPLHGRAEHAQLSVVPGSRHRPGSMERPCRRIAAGIALSGAAPTSAVVPIQFQTSDYDGSPTLIGPAVGGVDLGAAGDGIGYADMKPLYDSLRTSGPGDSPLSLIVMEGGVHTDFVDTPFITRTPWSLAVSAHYATDWLGCFLGGSHRRLFSASHASGPSLQLVRQRSIARRPAAPAERLHHRPHDGVAE